MHKDSSDWLAGRPVSGSTTGALDPDHAAWDCPATSVPLSDLIACREAVLTHTSPLGAEPEEQILAAIEDAVLRILEQRNRREGLPSQWVRGRFWAWLGRRKKG